MKKILTITVFLSLIIFISYKTNIKAMDWNPEKARQLGSLINQADKYLNGDGVPKDPVKARELFEQVIDLGNKSSKHGAYDSGSGHAYYQLGLIYEQGLGVPKDTSKAQQMYEQAVDLANNDRAAFRLGKMYETSQDYNKAYGLFAKTATIDPYKKEPIEALKNIIPQLEKLSEQNNAQASYNLGQMYDLKEWNKEWRDVQKARKMYLKARKQAFEAGEKQIENEALQALELLETLSRMNPQPWKR